MNDQTIERAPLTDVVPPGGSAIVEIPVLLEAEQLKALEAAARAHGLTAGTLVRYLLRDFLSCCDGPGDANSPSSRIRKETGIG